MQKAAINITPLTGSYEHITGTQRSSMLYILRIITCRLVVFIAVVEPGRVQVEICVIVCFQIVHNLK